MGKFNNLLTAIILSAVIISPLSYNVLASSNEVRIRRIVTVQLIVARISVCKIPLYKVK